jgi:DNA polymerase alpha subunit A
MDFINPPPKEECTKEKWGFLPKLIDGIVNQRQKCKKAMKTASAEKCIILDIQQKSYKIVANSIYGCLGFSISRFYSKPMAALITRMGREALQRANDIVSARGGVEVIYGDTDSLMIQPTSLNKETDKEKLFEIKTIADDLKKSINKEYVNLEIDIDGIFKPILLLMKKKYVANKLQNF